MLESIMQMSREELADNFEFLARNYQTMGELPHEYIQKLVKYSSTDDLSWVKPTADFWSSYLQALSILAAEAVPKA